MSETRSELVHVPLQPPAPVAPMGLAGVNIEALLEKALTAESAVEILERLMVMRREMKAESAKEAFDAAMSAFQAECPVIHKDSTVRGEKFSYNYAPLDSIVHQTKAIIEKHGFSYRVTAEVQGQDVKATCRVIHCQGHSEESSFQVPIDPGARMNQAQKFASALTFAKRYAFCNAFGILTGDQDDDGGASGDNRAGHAPTTRPPAQQQTRPTQQPAAPTQQPVKPANVTSGDTRTKPPEKVATTPAKFATAVTRNWAIKELANPEGTTADAEPSPQMLAFIHEFLVKAGCLMPNESLQAWPLRYVPVDKSQLAQVRKALVEFERGGEARFPFHNTDPNPPEPAAKPTKAKPEDKQQAIEVPREGAETTGEAWRDYRIQFGKHQGKRLEDLDKNVLWGFWKNTKVELEWNGKPRPADKIESDKLFRAMLDEAGKHYQFTQ
jgi:hypothetical protein